MRRIPAPRRCARALLTAAGLASLTACTGAVWDLSDASSAVLLSDSTCLVGYHQVLRRATDLAETEWETIDDRHVLFTVDVNSRDLRVLHVNPLPVPPDARRQLIVQTTDGVDAVIWHTGVTWWLKLATGESAPLDLQGEIDASGVDGRPLKVVLLGDRTLLVTTDSQHTQHLRTPDGRWIRIGRGKLQAHDDRLVELEVSYSETAFYDWRSMKDAGAHAPLKRPPLECGTSGRPGGILIAEERRRPWARVHVKGYGSRENLGREIFHNGVPLCEAPSILGAMRCPPPLRE
ncbi:MAG: hypothetical protein H6739_29025 [Alphaproteobacteria bacterium]|nr:hypothetical protein [Alphaproteobacteria bacterium]